MATQSEHHNEQTGLQKLHEVLDSGTLQQVARMLNALRPAEIAHLLEGLPLEKREIVWGLVEDDCEGEILVELADEVFTDLVSKMNKEELLAAAEGMDTDDLADLIQDLPRTVTWELINSLDKQRRERLESVLYYPEDTAGGMMNTDTLTVRAEVTLDVVLRYLRRRKDKIPSQTDSLIVVNRDDKYLGVLSLTNLLTHEPSDTVAEVMSLDLKPIPASWPERKVANRFEQHDLVSAPVVNDDGKLVGRITVDDVVDVIREEGEHQFMGQAGLTEDADMFAPVVVSAKRRALWLGVNLMTAFLASWVIGLFEHTIEQIVALAVLMPIVASMGGVAGSQTLTLVIRGLALGQLTNQNARSLMIKELAVSLLNSLIWAVVVGVVAGLWFDSRDIALLIGVALTINLLFAAITGAALPMMLERLGIDPALAGGVLLTTVTDVVGFLAFLGLATVFLL